MRLEREYDARMSVAETWSERACLGFIVALFVAIACAQSYRMGEREGKKAGDTVMVGSYKKGWDACMEQF